MSTPKYQMHDIVYLAESAKVGFLESYEVAGIQFDGTSEWLYKIKVPLRPPIGNATYGDRITLHNTVDFQLKESELIEYCDAIDLALVAARINLNRLVQLKSLHCAESGSSTGTDTGTGSGV